MRPIRQLERGHMTRPDEKATWTDVAVVSILTGGVLGAVWMILQAAPFGC